MSLLDEAVEDGLGPFLGTIYGAPGTGKNTLACQFPNPFMIQTVGETTPLDAPVKPKKLPGFTDTTEKLWSQFTALIKEDHPYKTLIIDTVSGLDTLFTHEVDPNGQGLAKVNGGYGAGYKAVEARHMKLRRAVESLRKAKGMHVVFLAHARIETIMPPDGEQYNFYNIKTGKDTEKNYVDAVDFVGFLRQDRVLLGDEGKKRAKSTDTVTLICQKDPAYVTKNRLGITEELEVKKGENPLAKHLNIVEGE